MKNFCLNILKQFFLICRPFFQIILLILKIDYVIRLYKNFLKKKENPPSFELIFHNVSKSVSFASFENSEKQMFLDQKKQILESEFSFIDILSVLTKLYEQEQKFTGPVSISLFQENNYFKALKKNFLEASLVAKNSKKLVLYENFFKKKISTHFFSKIDAYDVFNLYYNISFSQQFFVSENYQLRDNCSFDIFFMDYWYTSLYLLNAKVRKRAQGITFILDETRNIYGYINLAYALNLNSIEKYFLTLQNFKDSFLEFNVSSIEMLFLNKKYLNLFYEQLLIRYNYSFVSYQNSFFSYTKLRYINKLYIFIFKFFWERVTVLKLSLFLCSFFFFLSVVFGWLNFIFLVIILFYVIILFSNQYIFLQLFFKKDNKVNILTREKFLLLNYKSVQLEDIKFFSNDYKFFLKKILNTQNNLLISLPEDFKADNLITVSTYLDFEKNFFDKYILQLVYFSFLDLIMNANFILYYHKNTKPAIQNVFLDVLVLSHDSFQQEQFLFLKKNLFFEKNYFNISKKYCINNQNSLLLYYFLNETFFFSETFLLYQKTCSSYQNKRNLYFFFFQLIEKILFKLQDSLHKNQKFIITENVFFLEVIKNIFFTDYANIIFSKSEISVEFNRIFVLFKTLNATMSNPFLNFDFDSNYFKDLLFYNNFLTFKEIDYLIEAKVDILKMDTFLKATFNTSLSSLQKKKEVDKTTFLLTDNYISDIYGFIENYTFWPIFIELNPYDLESLVVDNYEPLTNMDFKELDIMHFNLFALYKNTIEIQQNVQQYFSLLNNCFDCNTVLVTSNFNQLEWKNEFNAFFNKTESMFISTGGYLSMRDEVLNLRSLKDFIEIKFSDVILEEYKLILLERDIWTDQDLQVIEDLKIEDFANLHNFNEGELRSYIYLHSVKKHYGLQPITYGMQEINSSELDFFYMKLFSEIFYATQDDNPVSNLIYENYFLFDQENDIVTLENSNLILDYFYDYYADIQLTFLDSDMIIRQASSIIDNEAIFIENDDFFELEDLYVFDNEYIQNNMAYDILFWHRSGDDIFEPVMDFKYLDDKKLELVNNVVYPFLGTHIESHFMIDKFISDEFIVEDDYIGLHIDYFEDSAFLIDDTYLDDSVFDDYEKTFWDLIMDYREEQHEVFANIDPIFFFSPLQIYQNRDFYTKRRKVETLTDDFALYYNVLDTFKTKICSVLLAEMYIEKSFFLKKYHFFFNKKTLNFIFYEIKNNKCPKWILNHTFFFEEFTKRYLNILYKLNIFYDQHNHLPVNTIFQSILHDLPVDTLKYEFTPYTDPRSMHEIHELTKVTLTEIPNINHDTFIHQSTIIKAIINTLNKDILSLELPFLNAREKNQFMNIQSYLFYTSHFLFTKNMLENVKFPYNLLRFKKLFFDLSFSLNYEFEFFCFRFFLYYFNFTLFNIGKQKILYSDLIQYYLKKYNLSFLRIPHEIHDIKRLYELLTTTEIYLKKNYFLKNVFTTKINTFDDTLVDVSDYINDFFHQMFISNYLSFTKEFFYTTQMHEQFFLEKKINQHFSYLIVRRFPPYTKEFLLLKPTDQSIGQIPSIKFNDYYVPDYFVNFYFCEIEFDFDGEGFFF